MNFHVTAVSPDLWRVLQTLMRLSALADFYLVGGTALALRLGHRKSVDLDFFTHAPFDARQLLEDLRDHLPFEQTETARNTCRGFVNGIKIECIAHQYPLLKPVEILDGIRIASLEDLAAFKANAIANRGAKKDFWDVHALLEKISLTALFRLCEKKYKGESLWNLEKSLLYFDDADLDPDPRDLRGMQWTQIKDNLRKHIACQRTSSDSDDSFLEPGPLAQSLHDKALIIDIREPNERHDAPAHILSMPNVPRSDWESIPDRFPQRPIVLCCAGGVRTRMCVEALGHPPGIFAWTRPIHDW